jgi:hypothetical protein
MDTAKLTATDETLPVVVFDNAGEIDPRLISTFGVNVKDGDDAIGFFGTGLKYALAILLRTGHRVTIQSGRETFVFSLQPTVIRGKSFDFVAMNGAPLGFTAEVGKTWKLWMAYRELFCNCQDEHGEVYEVSRAPMPMAGKTRVIVEGEEFAEVRRNHGRYFISDEPIHRGKVGNIHRSPAHGIYYRGVLVGCVGRGEPLLYGYNFTSPLELTEDRTAKHGYQVMAKIAQMVCGCDDPDIVRRCVTAPKGYYEHDADFDWPSVRPSEAFMSVVGDLVRKDMCRVNLSARAVWEKHAHTKAEPDPFEPDGFEQMMLDRATAFCCQFGFPVTDYPVVTVESMGSGILGRARDGKIYVSRQNFILGTKQLAATLIEEFIHLRHGVEDCTRAMQEQLLNHLVTLGERIQGEPL